MNDEEKVVHLERFIEFKFIRGVNNSEFVEDLGFDVYMIEFTA